MGVSVLTCKLPFGDEIENNDASSAMFRPFHRTLQGGAPMGRIAYAFVATGGQSPPPDLDVPDSSERQADASTGEVRLFGTYCLMDGRRLAFFPGIKGDVLTSYAEDGCAISRQEFSIDHFSLDEDGRRWHITERRSDGSRRHIRNPRSFSFGNGWIHWFSITLRDSEELERAHKANVLTANLPEADTVRRTALAMASVEKAKHNVMWPQNDPPTATPNFWHFNVLVQFGACDVNTMPRTAFLAPPDSMVDPVLAVNNLPNRVHPVAVVGFRGTVWVTVSRLPGAFKERTLVSHRSQGAQHIRAAAG